MTFPLTNTQIAANQVAVNMSRVASSDLNQYRQQYKSIFGVTLQTGGQTPQTVGSIAPQDILTALGTNAAPIMALLAAKYAYLEAISAGVVAGDALPAYTANSDGTVTLSVS